METSLAYSSDVDIYLIVDGKRIEVAGCLGQKCTLREVREVPPCHADLVIIIDGQERRKRVYLPNGISKDSDEVEFQ